MNPFSTVALTFSQIARAGWQNVKITLVPLLVIIAAVAAPAMLLELRPNGAPPPAAAVFIVLVWMFVVCWIFVNFHRHVLLGEAFGWLPRIHPRVIGRYFVAALVIGLVTLLLADQLFSLTVRALLLSNVAFTPGPYFFNMLLIPIGVVAGTISLMLVATLPAIATDKPWRAALCAASSKFLFWFLLSATFTLLWLVYWGLLYLSQMLLLENVAGVAPQSTAKLVLSICGIFVLSFFVTVSSILLSASMFTAIYRTLVPRSER